MRREEYIHMLAVPTAIIASALINTEIKELIENEADPDAAHAAQSDLTIPTEKPTRRS